MARRRLLLVRLAPLLALALVLVGCGHSPRDAVAPRPASAGAAGQPAASASAATADPATIVARATVPVLCFHQVRDWRASDSAADRSIITPPSVLAKQMDVLARHHFTPITSDALYAHLTTGAPLPPQPILLTFDDGSESQVANAVPILERHHFPAVFFPMTVVLDKPQWITRDQLRRLGASGISVGSHTYDHNDVAHYKGADFQTQLVDPRRDLSRIVGKPVDDFAYPYGSWRRSSLPHVKAAGYRMAFGLDTPMDRTLPLFSYPRVIVPPTWSEARLLQGIATAARPTTNDAEAGGA